MTTAKRRRQDDDEEGMTKVAMNKAERLQMSHQEEIVKCLFGFTNPVPFDEIESFAESIACIAYQRYRDHMPVAEVMAVRRKVFLALMAHMEEEKDVGMPDRMTIIRMVASSAPSSSEMDTTQFGDYLLAESIKMMRNFSRPEKIDLKNWSPRHGIK